MKCQLIHFIVCLIADAISCLTHHTLVPDDRHPLLSAVYPLGDESKIVLTHSSLGSVKCAVGTGGHVQVPTTDTKLYNNKH